MIRRMACLICILGALAACAGGEEFDYTPADEIPPGKGLFSGDDGKFTLEL